MLTADQIQNSRDRVEALKGYLAIDRKRIDILEDEKLTQDPEFWNDAKEAEKVMRRMRGKKAWVEQYEAAETAVEDLQVLYEFFKEGESTEEEVEAQNADLIQKIEELEFKQMLSDEADGLNAVIQITAGAGGTESCDWAGMLLRMYTMYADKAGFKVKEIDRQDGDVAGVKQITMEVDGDYAFSMLKGETGSIAWCASAPMTLRRAATPRSSRFTCTRWWMTASRSRSTPRTSPGTPSALGGRAART